MTTDNQTKPPLGLYGRVLDYANYWFTKTPPMHKFLDVLVLFVAVLLGGVLWVGYQRTDALLSFVRHSLEEYPSINIKEVDRLWPQIWAKCKETGALAVELHAVDLARNTRTLLRRSTDVPNADELYGPIGRTKPFLQPGFSPVHLAGAAALVTGDSVIIPRLEPTTEVGLFVPIPDHPGQLLCGVILVAYAEGTPEADMGVARVALLEFTDEIIQ
jgi:hypothetical protein